MMEQLQKRTHADLAIFGGAKLFDRPRSTSNLVQPDIEKFLNYSRIFYRARQYTNNGPLVRELERRLAKFHDTQYCVTFCSGFWALVLAIRALAIPGKTEVVMPSLTYRRLADVVSWAGLVPRFCEVDPQTLAISPVSAESQICYKTALVIGVHPIVNCCDAVALERMAQRHGIPLLIDGVESVFESIQGRRVGSFGRGECFSLHASKLLNGFEGGYLTTNDPDLAAQLSLSRGFGISGPESVIGFGTNAKLNEVHAAMALACLDDLDGQVMRNRDRYRTYQETLKDVSGIRMLSFDESERCSFKNIVIELTDDWPISRELTLSILNSEGVLARAYYSPPLHLKKPTYPVITTNLPYTEYLAERFVLMPCGQLVSTEDILKVVCLLVFIKANVEHIRACAPAGIRQW